MREASRAAIAAGAVTVVLTAADVVPEVWGCTQAEWRCGYPVKSPLYNAADALGFTQHGVPGYVAWSLLVGVLVVGAVVAVDAVIRRVSR